jgi:hypothetical protein
LNQDKKQLTEKTKELAKNKIYLENILKQKENEIKELSPIPQIKPKLYPQYTCFKTLNGH